MRVLAILLPLLLCSCALEFQGEGRSLSVGLPKPPTNAVVAIPYRKIGIIAGQNPATQQPSVTIGFESGAYYRVPPGFNMWSTITTTHEGFKTTIIDSFVVMHTNAP
jgi:hypothetical protein